MRTFTAYVEWDPETRLYVGTVPGVVGAHTPAATLDELNANLDEVLTLCLGCTPIAEEEMSTKDTKVTK